MAKVLLDTDILSEYLKGHDRNVIRRAADYAREQGVFTFTSVTVHGSLSLGDVEELMAERGLSVDRTTIWRWNQAYAAEVQRRLRGQLKPKGSTWHIDETFVRISGRWMYLFRAVDSIETFRLRMANLATRELFA